ncbi:MAG: hypothetical protein IPQ05_16045 [Leptospiraceae bacterium]|nr:hypothetical protein [Leptospiraceae bacterium]
MTYLILILAFFSTMTFAQDTQPSVNAAPPKKAVIGFQKGQFYLSASTGLLTASGSLIDTDRSYNDTLSTQSQLGLIENKTQPFVTPFKYKPSGSNSGSLEYSLTDNIGVGVSMLQFSIHGNGQSRYQNYSNTGASGNSNYVRTKDQTLYSVPGSYLMYSGTNMMLSGSYHFISKSVLDPYVHLKAGGGTFLSSSHRNLYDDDKYFLKTGDFSGLSKIVGIGAGVNFFILEEMGIKFELEHYRQYLSCTNFSSKTLDTTHVQIGLVFNLTTLQSGVTKVQK